MKLVNGISGDRQARPRSAQPLPLCVDLDGTLVKTDLLHEAAITFATRQPWSAWRLVLWAAEGASTLKQRLSEQIAIDPACLPYRDDLIEHMLSHRAQQGSVHLITASPQRWANAVAHHLGFFDSVIASTAEINLKGSVKAEALVRQFGPGGFLYVGDSLHDAPVWAVADTAFGAGPRALRYLPKGSKIFASTDAPSLAMLHALRPHQWLKNLLVFVPLLTSHGIANPEMLLSALAAFVAFCCCASSAYLTNDIIDLNADRIHPRKRLRPFASGSLPLWAGIALAPLLLLCAALFCLATTSAVAILLAGYYLLTQAYSLTLKRRAPADVFTLAGLYTIRVIAGAAAIGVPLSLWLAAFSIFTFLGLAVLKRQAELVDAVARDVDIAPGRGYRTADGPTLVPMGIASGFCSVLVLTLYVAQPHVAVMYRTPALLWLIAPPLLYWITRMWLLAQRRQMHDDPIVFAMRDAVSRNIIGLCLSIGAIATFVELPLPLQLH